MNFFTRLALTSLWFIPLYGQAQGLLQKAQQLQTGVVTSSAREGLVRAGELQAGLVAQKVAVAPGQPVLVGLRLIHDPHWHTYWRNPGDSGLPTKVDWRLPAGWKAQEIQWPTPMRLPVGPLANFGFEGDLVLPMVLTPPAGLSPGSEVRLEAQASWLVCKDVCIPGEATLALRLPVVAKDVPVADGPDASLFARAQAQTPVRESSRPVRAYLSDKLLTLTWSVSSSKEQPAKQETGYFFPYIEGLITPAAAQKLSQTSDGVRLDIPLGESPTRAVAELRKAKQLGGVWVTGQGPGVEWNAVLAAGEAPVATTLLDAGKTAAQERPEPVKSAGSESGLWLAIGGALLGGLILNLMPCVFPVIGLKVLSFAQSAHSRAAAIQHALVFSLGVVLSFLALAGLLIALRAAGDAVGWGFQLQNPWVVGLLSLLFVAIAINLLGGFEMGLLASRAANLDFSHRVAGAGGAMGAFGSGVLAVVVASPCTAPFMGSAIGFTTTAGIPQTLAVFAALGLGMALPYLLLAASPGLLARLPRPGPWMQRFKQALAFPMLAASAWLIWVLASIQGTDAVLWILVAATSLAMLLWIYGSFVQMGRAGLFSWVAMLALAAAVVMSLRAMATPGPLSSASPVTSPAATGAARVTSAGPAEASAAAIVWQPWAPGLAEQAAAQGKTVFVDFTANWCISCQASKVRVLQTDAIAAAFARHQVVALRADWTRRDPLIANELARHGRSGVPLYLVYSKKGGAPKVLSEWLTESEVLSAIQ
jgi:thiol:disulfide interchange protein/DsbC/DsbD-like thiol-disulfide interchange protein